MSRFHIGQRVRVISAIPSSSDLPRVIGATGLIASLPITCSCGCSSVGYAVELDEHPWPSGDPLTFAAGCLAPVDTDPLVEWHEFAESIGY